MMKQVKISTSTCCAFCKYWYDPTNSHIQPVNPKEKFWKYDLDAKSQCSAYSTSFRETKASFTCRKYECKIDI